MDILFTDTLDNITDGDNIILPGVKRDSYDILENVVVTDLGAAIKVVGWSHNSGDKATYMRDPFTTVEVWEA